MNIRFGDLCGGTIELVLKVDTGLYEKIGGIETSRMIRNLYGVQVMYV
jgi:hypothetical protein